jgi:hypothetical protein
MIVTGGGTTPVPAIENVREKGDTLSHTPIVPVKEPRAVGWNVAVNWHEVPGAYEAVEQVVEQVKGPP